MTELLTKNLNVEITGQHNGDSVVILHGWGSSASVMRSVANGLADVFKVHNLDLPGHGLTPEPPTAWGVPDYAALVADYIRELNAGPVPIIGHSNGGRIGLFIASDPDMASVVSKLALVSPSGMKPRRGSTYYAKRAVAIILKAPFQILPPPWRNKGLSWLKRSLVWRALGSRDYRDISGVMRDTFVRTVNCYLEDRVSKITVPVLIFRGENDTAVSSEQVNRLIQLIPDAGLVSLPDAGHYGFLDQPATFLSAVRYFLGIQ